MSCFIDGRSGFTVSLSTVPMKRTLLFAIECVSEETITNSYFAYHLSPLLRHLHVTALTIQICCPTINVFHALIPLYSTFRYLPLMEMAYRLIVSPRFMFSLYILNDNSLYTLDLCFAHRVRQVC